MARITPIRAPALPLAEPDYTRSFKDRYSSVLRLYFNQIDGIFQNLLGDNGGQYLQNPHIAATGNTDQYADGDDSPTLVLFDTVETASGFTLNIDGSATANQDGVYKIDYSLQLINTANVSHDTFVWLKTNGSLVTDSSSRFTVPARKSAGVYGFVVAYSSIEFKIAKDDVIQLYWATETAYDPVGPVNGVYLEAIAAQTLPYPRPANPSAVGSINYVSRLP